MAGDFLSRKPNGQGSHPITIIGEEPVSVIEVEKTPSHLAPSLLPVPIAIGDMLGRVVELPLLDCLDVSRVVVELRFNAAERPGRLDEVLEHEAAQGDHHGTDETNRPSGHEPT